MEKYRKRLQENCRLYRDYKDTIDSIQETLRREIPLLTHEFNLSTHMLNEYINDRLTMFHYLSKCKFSIPTTLSLLLDTLRWRIIHRVDYIRISNDSLNNPLVYFHKTDKLNRPLLTVHLSRLSTDDPTPLVIFVLETARLHIQQQSNVFDIHVLLDFKNTTLPLDTCVWGSILTRYPGLIGTVSVFNSNLMHQLIIPEDVISTSGDLIDLENLLKEFGGTDTFQWTLDQDMYFKRHRPDQSSNNPSSLIPVSLTSSDTKSMVPKLSNEVLPIQLPGSGWRVRYMEKIKKNKRAVCWIAAGVLLRNGVQELCQRLLLVMMKVVFLKQPSAMRLVHLLS